MLRALRHAHRIGGAILFDGMVCSQLRKSQRASIHSASDRASGVFIYASPAGVLVTWPSEVAHIRSLFEKPRGKEVMTHFHEHCGTWGTSFRRRPSRCFGPRGQRSQAELANDYEAVRELVHETLHAQIGMRLRDPAVREYWLRRWKLAHDKVVLGAIFPATNFTASKIRRRISSARPPTRRICWDFTGRQLSRRRQSSLSIARTFPLVFRRWEWKSCNGGGMVIG